MSKYILLVILTIAILISGCTKPKEPPAPIPKGILVDQIPPSADVIFTSVRHVLSDKSCLDSNYNLKKNFINDPGCNKVIYDKGRLASPRQLFVMDLETGNVTQITNTDCFFITAQVVDSGTVMTLATCSDTNGNGKIDEMDKGELYFVDLATEKMDCLTCNSGLDAINNADYSKVTKKIAFSARNGTDLRYPNHIFTVDAQKNIAQLTNATEMDFDCAWSEDGTKVVFNRVPLPIFTKPAQVWLMDSDGTNEEKITSGGSNPNNESPLNGVYVIGLDADPDMSPDNKKIVFSRLKTAKQNEPFGVYELVIIDVATKQEQVLDSSYTNMIPEWKSGGILFIRQIAGTTKPMDIKQSLYLYKDGTFKELEKYPYNVFPIGAYGGSWIE